MTRKILAANFKSNLTLPKIKDYFSKLDSKILEGDEVCVFPPFFGMSERAERFSIGVQNAYPAQKGAFSGEITLEALQDFGIDSILIGHSERRNLLGESQEFCAQKFEFFAKQGFRIFYCIGESLEVRERGRGAIEEFLASQFEGIDTNYKNLIIAYEPIWAIGSGVSAQASEIEERHAYLRSLVSCPLLYGGSVQVGNLEEILRIKNVDGVLVGSAALEVENFIKMLEIVRQMKGA